VARPELAKHTRSAYSISKEFIESRLFSRQRGDCLTDDELRQLEEFLSDRPEAGDPIEGTGGIRKIRWGNERRGKGRRSGSRVIYFYFSSASEIYLMTVYEKTRKEDLTSGEKRLLRDMLTAEKALREG